MSPLKGIIDVLHDSTTSPPPKLYKCAHIEDDKSIRHTRSVLEGNELYFSSPDCFNDPFDSVTKFIANGSRADWKRFFREQWPYYRADMKRTEQLRHEKEFLRQREDFAKKFESDIIAKRRLFGVFCMTHKRDNILSVGPL